MRRFISVALMLLVTITFIGCDKYERDTSSGSIAEITIDESLKIAKEEEAIILYTLSTCDDCKKLKDILLPYLENHSIEINEIVLDKEGTSTDEIQNNRKNINTVFDEFDSVPSMYYVKNGEIIDDIFEIHDVVELEEWVVNNKLDKK